MFDPDKSLYIETPDEESAILHTVNFYRLEVMAMNAGMMVLGVCSVVFLIGGMWTEMIAAAGLAGANSIIKIRAKSLAIVREVYDFAGISDD